MLNETRVVKVFETRMWLSVLVPLLKLLSSNSCSIKHMETTEEGHGNKEKQKNKRTKTAEDRRNIKDTQKEGKNNNKQ